jgi:uncharacterized protein
MTLITRCLLPALAALLALTTPAIAEPAMWEIRDENSAIWLFGSFHVLPWDAQWQTAQFNSILAHADKVVFEADMRAEAVEQVGAQAFVRGVYTDGSLLTDLLTDEEEARLRSEVEAIGLQIGPMLAMRPWMAATAIGAQALTGKGFDGPGVEFIIQPGLAGERLAFLETAEQQLDVLAAAPEDEQVATLLSTLDQLPMMPKLMRKMLRSWLSGTPEQLGDLFLTEKGGFDAAFLERLLYARNENWITPLETMLAEGEENLVIVGAAHLIGDRSVLALLEQAGYEVERIQ